MKKSTAVICKYCVGCGLCESEKNCGLKQDEKGFWGISGCDAETNSVFLESICPVLGNKTDYLNGNLVFGTAYSAKFGYASNPVIRHNASSGGAITAIAMFLLETQRVDGVIQVKKDPGVPYGTICRVSKTKEEIAECCGSRYSISSPWKGLAESVEQGKKYAAVGKPCDIAALRNAQNAYGIYSNIEILLSFFCAGMPSQNANNKLLERLNCKKEECNDLRYRGNGWPGEATAVDNKGGKHTLPYDIAWGGILGRDVHSYCRLCIDGIGEAADISCGDGWYLKNNYEPDFSEREGRNVIFARTKRGDDLLKAAVDHGALMVTDEEVTSGYLKKIQKYQFMRRATMLDKIRAYRLLGKETPKYSKKLLKEYAKEAGKRQRIKIFMGTVKRIIKGAI